MSPCGGNPAGVPVGGPFLIPGVVLLAVSIPIQALDRTGEVPYYIVMRYIAARCTLLKEYS